MAKQPLTPQPEYLPYPAYLRPETETHRLMQRHLQDPRHVITEDELRRLQVGWPEPERKDERN